MRAVAWAPLRCVPASIHGSLDRQQEIRRALDLVDDEQTRRLQKGVWLALGPVQNLDVVEGQVGQVRRQPLD
jgi:hypothetical protein